MKNDRHTVVGVNCFWCKKLFMARAERVAKGQGRFCGKECFDKWQRQQKRDTTWGRKDLAKCYKTGDKYSARWYDKNGKTKSSPYPRWWWEMNVGEISEGMIVLYKDNNPLNISPSNFELGTKSDALRRGGITRKENKRGWKEYIEKLRQKQIGFRHTPESKAKISKIHKGKKLSENHKKKIAERTKKMWKDGIFNNVKFSDIAKENNPHWRGGIENKYDYEFRQMCPFIKSRDNHICQICSKSVYKSKHGHVHHIDGNTSNNGQSNLILLCSSCHAKVHSSGMQSPPIMALRSELYWSK